MNTKGIREMRASGVVIHGNGHRCWLQFKVVFFSFHSDPYVTLILPECFLSAGNSAYQTCILKQNDCRKSNFIA